MDVMRELYPKELRLGRIQPGIGCAERRRTGDVLAENPAIVEGILDEQVERKFRPFIADRKIGRGEAQGVADRRRAGGGEIGCRSALVVEARLEIGLAPAEIEFV